MFASASAAIAQDSTIATSKKEKATPPAAEDAIVVTGSLLRRTSVETPSPVTILTSDTLAKAGITNINDAIRSISADGAGSISTGFQAGFSAGGAAVSLRGLGVSSTLVLVDGLRSTNFPLNDDGHNSYVDLNSIPFSAVEQVLVLKDGASATYGADAIGGVVNIIMKKHFTGVSGLIEGGLSEHKDADHRRANLTLGYGDYSDIGWNFYVNGEYQKDDAVAASDRGFPYNTKDLSSLGLADLNPADSSLSTSTVNAVVRLAGQSDLNDLFSGGAAPTGTYTTLNLSNCAGNTYTVEGAAGGVGCKHDNTAEFGQIQPRQERYSATARLSIRLTDDIEGYITGSYSFNEVDIKGTPAAIRQSQPFGAPPSAASNNPGVVLPVYVCSKGVDCATATDRMLNPNNPYAAAFADNPAAGAARIYYLFGDIPVGTQRKNEVIRGAAGLHGTFGDSWDSTRSARRTI
jgi:iron complex outermembrane receptor protein